MGLDSLMGQRVCAGSFKDVCGLVDNAVDGIRSTIAQPDGPGLKVDENGHFYRKTGIPALDEFDSQQRQQMDEFMKNHPEIEKELNDYAVRGTLLTPAPEIPELEAFKNQQATARQEFLNENPDIQKQLDQVQFNKSGGLKMGIGGP